MAAIQSDIPDWIIKAPKDAAAPAEALNISAPRQIWNTPNANTRALFHHGTLIFLISATGKRGISVATFYKAYSVLSSLPYVISIIEESGCQVISAY